MVDNKVRIVAVALVSLVVVLRLAGSLRTQRSRLLMAIRSVSGTTSWQGNGLMWSTLEDEAQIDKLGLLKRITLDAPPERVLSIMAQVSKAANNTLEELGATVSWSLE